MRTDAHVPGDWWRSSSIGWVDEHHGFMRVLKQESIEDKLTCITLAMARVFLRWRKPNWEKYEIGDLW
jgi:hypothetical protein